MLDKIRKSFQEGLKRAKWIALFIADRTRVETSVARLLFESSKLESKCDDIYRDIGRRVVELKDREEKAVLKDFIILQSIGEVKKIREQIEEYKKKAHELNRPAE